MKLTELRKTLAGMLEWASVKKSGAIRRKIEAVLEGIGEGGDFEASVAGELWKREQEANKNLLAVRKAYVDLDRERVRCVAVFETEVAAHAKTNTQLKGQSEQIREFERTLKWKMETIERLQDRQFVESDKNSQLARTIKDKDAVIRQGECRELELIGNCDKLLSAAESMKAMIQNERKRSLECSDENDALRARLIEAKQRIRDLESPVTANTDPCSS